MIGEQNGKVLVWRTQRHLHIMDVDADRVVKAKHLMDVTAVSVSEKANLFMTGDETGKLYLWRL